MNFLVYSNNVDRFLFLKDNILKTFGDSVKIHFMYGDLKSFKDFESKALFLLNRFIGRQILVLDFLNTFSVKGPIFILDDDVYFFNNTITKEFSPFKLIYYVPDPFFRPYFKFKVNANGGFLIFSTPFVVKKWAEFCIKFFVKFLHNKDYTDPIRKDLTRLEQNATSLFISKYRIFSKPLKSVFLVLQDGLKLEFLQRYSAVHYIFDKKRYEIELRNFRR